MGTTCIEKSAPFDLNKILPNNFESTKNIDDLNFETNTSFNRTDLRINKANTYNPNNRTIKTGAGVE
jgi:hypothetical protein